MANGSTNIDATARQYMRQAAMGEEDSVAAPAGSRGCWSIIGFSMWFMIFELVEM